MRVTKIQLSTFVLIFFVLNHVHSEDTNNEESSSDETEFRLPTPKELFNSAKQLIAGYSLAFVSSTMNKVCSSALSPKMRYKKYIPEIERMNFQLLTPCQREHFPLLEAQKILESPNFDPKKKVVVLASGWTTNANDTDIIDIIGQGYHCRGDTNFIAVDAGNFVRTLYSWSSFNTEDIGNYVAEGLKKIAEVVPVENISLVGHSLGAHIVGQAARRFKELTGKVLPRITGLDPAKPCFKESDKLDGIQSGDAAFVDIIHSNPSVLGLSDAIGDADFYPNGLSPLPPGCNEIVCAHGRSWLYFAESLYPGQEYNFIGKRCESRDELKEGECSGEEAPMGHVTPSHKKGTFILNVRSEAPYGKNADVMRAKFISNCGTC